MIAALTSQPTPMFYIGLILLSTTHRGDCFHVVRPMCVWSRVASVGQLWWSTISSNKDLCQGPQEKQTLTLRGLLKLQIQSMSVFV